MRNFLLSVRQFFSVSILTSSPLLSCHSGAASAEIWRHIDFSRWRPRSFNTTSGFVFVDVYLPSEGRNLSTNQISSTSMINIYHFFGWDITTSGLEKQTSTILEFYFRFQSQPFSRNLHFILHQSAEFRLNRSSHCGNITSYRFIKMAASDAEYYFRFRICWYHCLCANQISSTYLNWWLRFNYFRFWKTNVRHIGILLPVLISTTSLACHSASRYGISSKSEHPLHKYDVISIFQDGGHDH